MQQQLANIVSEATSAAPGIKTRPEFEVFKAKFVGAKGSMTSVMKLMGSVPKEEKPAMGKLINEAKGKLEAVFSETLARIEEAELAARLGAPIDPTLPPPDDFAGTRHPLAQIREEVCSVSHYLWPLTFMVNN